MSHAEAISHFNIGHYAKTAPIPHEWVYYGKFPQLAGFEQEWDFKAVYQEDMRPSVPVPPFRNPRFKNLVKCCRSENPMVVPDFFEPDENGKRRKVQKWAILQNDPSVAHMQLCRNLEGRVDVHNFSYAEVKRYSGTLDPLTYAGLAYGSLARVKREDLLISPKAQQDLVKIMLT